MRLIRASELSGHALVDLFNAGYSDYLLPMRLTDAAFAEHVAANDIDLECSRVVRDGQPAALALIAHRDGAGWVGGLATVPEYRRRGLGAEALAAGLAALADRGARVAWLEVIDQNRRALALYEKLGFEVVRDLVVWSLPARATHSTASRAIDASSAHAWIRANRQAREPWQRADESVTAIGARGATLRGLVVDRDGRVVATALLRDGDAPVVEALQVAATDEQAAAELLLAAAGAGRELRFRNVPDGAPASLALKRLGARRIATQHEMRVTL
jgi:ribosomal protein S18 acetylase RimI-like enzyme